MKEKSDIMRELLGSLISFKKEENKAFHDTQCDKKDCKDSEKSDSLVEDNIFNSNQSFSKIRKKIVKI